MDGSTGFTKFAFAAWGVMMGKDVASDREAGVLRFDDYAGDFVANYVGDLFVHVPRH